MSCQLLSYIRVHLFSAANSINWGRLVPQVCYHASSYLQLVQQRRIDLGEPVDVCIPTGNFGNILAAYYAKVLVCLSLFPCRIAFAQQKFVSGTVSCVCYRVLLSTVAFMYIHSLNVRQCQ